MALYPPPRCGPGISLQIYMAFLCPRERRCCSTLTASLAPMAGILSYAMARETPNPSPPTGPRRRERLAISSRRPDQPDHPADHAEPQVLSRCPLRASRRASGFNFSNVPVRKLDEGEFDVRLDHTFSSKDTIFARFSYDQATNFVPGGSPGFAEPSAFASTQNITNHGRNVALSETHIFSDRTINQISGGFNRIFNHILSFGDRSCEAAKLGIPGANLDSSCSGFPGGAPAGLSQSHDRLRQLRNDRDHLWAALTGGWGIAVSRPSRAGPTSSPSPTRST